MGGKGARLYGFDQFERRMTNPTWASKPAGDFLRRWVDFYRDVARRRAPVWRGRLRRSIKRQMDTAKFPLWARVFSDVPSAPFMEYGTGTRSDGPNARHRVHWPPARALNPWAQAHGFGPRGGFLVARKIGMRGGLEPRHFFRDAERAADRKLNGWLATMAKEMEAEASRGVA